MLTIDDLKLHCRIDDDGEDDLLEGIMDAATDAVADYLNLPVADIVADMPAPVKAAVLLLAADLYLFREAQADRQLYRNQTFDRLLAPYRVMSV